MSARATSPPNPTRLRALLLAFLGVLATVSLGCRDRLVGLHDVSLRYEVTGELPRAHAPPELRALALERLAAAEVSADVTSARPGELTVRVDEDFAGEVGKLLLWRGGLVVAVADLGDEPPGRLPSREAVARFVAETKPAVGHRFAVEPLEGGLGRPRSLAWPPLTEVDTAAVVADGPRLVVPLGPDARHALTEATGAPSERLAVVRDRTVLAILSPSSAVDDGRLIVPLGNSIYAYTEAADAVRLLRTARLPGLVEVSRTAVRPDWFLASANLVLPFAVSFAWLFFVRRFDRAQPEPVWLVVSTFALGALAVVPAGILEWGWDALSPWTNPTLLTFGRAPRAFPLALAGFIITVGISEEATKLLAAWSLATHRREFDEPVDGIVYGAAAALGFAAAENLRYLALGRVDSALVASRAFMSVPAHLFFGTIWGYALGRRLVEPHRRVWPLFLAAAALHGLFDTCLSVDGAGIWAVAVGLFVASLFIVHLRLSLRYGPVTRALRDPHGPRELFRMGSRRAFAGFVAAMYGFSGVVFALSLLEHTGRATLGFGAGSAVALALLGWAARGVAASLPLDVVVDDAGVTFAGAAVLYRDVVRIERGRVKGSPRKQEQMLIVGRSRRLTLGPANRATIDALAHALAMRLSSVALRG